MLFLEYLWFIEARNLSFMSGRIEKGVVPQFSGSFFERFLNPNICKTFDGTVKNNQATGVIDMQKSNFS